MATRKAWLLSEHNIGKGAGKGRISLEGHNLITTAISKGIVFDDASPKSPAKPKRARTTIKIDNGKKGAARFERTPKEDKPADGLHNPAVRKWAAANGFDVPARGRIAADVKEAYKAAVAPEDREQPEDPDLKFGPTPEPRYSANQLWAGTFEGKTVKVNGATVCIPCGYSLRWHSCHNPSAVVGSGVVIQLHPIS